jgi:hypothetical protein
MVRCKNAGGAPGDGDNSPPRRDEIARGKRIRYAVKKKRKTLSDAEVAQAVADAAEQAERGGRRSGLHIGERRFRLESRQLGTEATEGTEDAAPSEQMSVDPPSEQTQATETTPATEATQTTEAPQATEDTEEQAAQSPPRRRSTRARSQVTPRPEGPRRGARPPPRVRGSPPVVHLDLRGASSRQVKNLRFVEVSRWFPPVRDPRASEGFYTPLQEDFYRALVDS